MRKSVVASAALALALTGGGVAVAVSADAAPQHASHSQSITRVKKLTISSFTFSPGSLSVKHGGKIKIVNKDAVAHTVTSDDGTSFDIAVPAKSAVVFRAPATPGTYTYHCSIHITMHGQLVVK